MYEAGNVITEEVVTDIAKLINSVELILRPNFLQKKIYPHEIKWVKIQQKIRFKDKTVTKYLCHINGFEYYVVNINNQKIKIDIHA